MTTILIVIATVFVITAWMNKFEPFPDDPPTPEQEALLARLEARYGANWGDKEIREELAKLKYQAVK